MKAISVIGTSKTGKTTTIEKIIQELTKRGYRVGTIKEIHFHDFKMDTEGSNTDRHKKAGATLVTARGNDETDILFQEKLSVDEILSFYDQDFVIMEGVRDTLAPKIVTANNVEAIEERFDKTVFAISGVVSEEISEYKGLPAINALSHIGDLVDLIEEKSFNSLTETSSKPGLYLKIGGQDISMVPFVENTVKNTVEALVKELHGYTEDGDIQICIKR